jgi:hypothetical protein
LQEARIDHEHLALADHDRRVATLGAMLDLIYPVRELRDGAFLCGRR